MTFLVIPGCCDGGEVGYGAVARMVGKEKRAKWMRDVRLIWKHPKNHPLPPVPAALGCQEGNTGGSSCGDFSV